MPPPVAGPVPTQQRRRDPYQPSPYTGPTPVAQTVPSPVIPAAVQRPVPKPVIPMATAAKPGAPAQASANQRFQSGLRAQTARNQSNMKSLGLQVDKAGNQLNGKTHLGTGSWAGQSTRASGQHMGTTSLAGQPVSKTAAQPAPAKPAAAATPATAGPSSPAPIVPLPSGVGQTGTGSMFPEGYTGPGSLPTAQPASQADWDTMFPPKPLLPSPVIPAQQSAPQMPPPVIAAQPSVAPTAAAPVEFDDGEALNQYANQELGAVQWNNKFATGDRAKRGAIAVGGTYDGLTMDQARMRVEENFRRMSPDQKQRYSQRGAGLKHQPPGTVRPSLRGGATTTLMTQPPIVIDEDEDLFGGAG